MPPREDFAALVRHIDDVARAAAEIIKPCEGDTAPAKVVRRRIRRTVRGLPREIRTPYGDSVTKILDATEVMEWMLFVLRGRAPWPRRWWYGRREDIDEHAAHDAIELGETAITALEWTDKNTSVRDYLTETIDMLRVEDTDTEKWELIVYIEWMVWALETYGVDGISPRIKPGPLVRNTHRANDNDDAWVRPARESDSEREDP